MPWEARRYWFEALVCLSIARLALRLVPFARLTWILERKGQDYLRDGERARVREGVQWAISEASLYLPGETVCFPRAIAAQMMLRRRGITTTLYYGAATLPTRELKAHVWLQDGAIGVVGHETAGEYHILARYPEAKQS